MSAVQRESIEDEFFSRWVFDGDLYRRWVDDDYDVDKVIETMPTGINVEKLIGKCLAHVCITERSVSTSDFPWMIRNDALIDILIGADLIKVERVKEIHKEIGEEMKKDWDKNIKDFAVEAWPCSTD